MRGIWLIVGLAISGVLATGVLPFLSIHGVRPDLFLMIALAAAMTGRKDRAVTAAWITGLAKDFFSQGPFGAHAALFLLMALAVIHVRPYFNVELLSVQALLGGIAAGSVNALYFLALFVYYRHVGVVGAIGQIALASALTACLTPLVMLAAAGWMRFLRIAPGAALDHR